MEKSIFETVIIFNTKKRNKEKIINDEITKITEYLQTYSSTKKVKTEDIGEKKLAYEVRGHTTGYYAIFNWQGVSDNIKEVERVLRINDTVIKFINIRHDDPEFELEDLDISEQMDQDAEEPLLDIYQLLFNA